MKAIIYSVYAKFKTLYVVFIKTERTLDGYDISRLLTLLIDADELYIKH